jgi:hypothetical protein
MPFQHGVRDTVVIDKARKMLREEPLRDGCSRGDSGCSRKAAME